MDCMDIDIDFDSEISTFSCRAWPSMYTVDGLVSFAFLVCKNGQFIWSVIRLAWIKEATRRRALRGFTYKL